MSAVATQLTEQGLTPVRISRAERDDLPRLVSLLGGCVPGCTPQTVWELPWTWENYRKAETEDGRLVGAAALQRFDRHGAGRAPASDHWAEVRGLVVHGDWRGHGIARALVRRLIEDSDDAGLELVCVTRQPEFFARLGFRETFPSWIDVNRRPRTPGRAGRGRRVAMRLLREELRAERCAG